MKYQKLYEKFTALTWQKQLGNIASTLATISKQATIPQSDQLTIYLLREAVLMMEWCAKNIPQSFHLELAIMQKELLAWQKVFPIDQVRNILALQLRNQADILLDFSGLLNNEVENNQNNSPMSAERTLTKMLQEHSQNLT